MKLTELLRLFRFGIVGVIAAATHYLTVIALVELAGITPLIANVGGFAVAFWLSYFGHRLWTFGDVDTQNAASFPRFLAISLLGFSLNELVLYLLLRYTQIPYYIALAIAAVVVAFSTYVLSRLWAFRAPRLTQT
ncbi:MAG: GtrA family protein [Pseudomonadota bacterium]